MQDALIYIGDFYNLSTTTSNLSAIRHKISTYRHLSTTIVIKKLPGKFRQLFLLLT